MAQLSWRRVDTNLLNDQIFEKKILMPNFHELIDNVALQFLKILRGGFGLAI